jgi:predicted nucleic acid-binding protein
MRGEIMQIVIIDTDVAIDFLRGNNYAKELLSPLILSDLAYLSILSVYELHAGMRENERIKTQDFINACNVELVTMDIAIKAGELRRHYKTKGITLTSTDCLIAATAIIRKCKIATRNKNHYPDKSLLLDL